MIKNRDIAILFVIATVFVVVSVLLRTAGFETSQQQVVTLVNNSMLQFDAVAKIEINPIENAPERRSGSNAKILSAKRVGT